MRLGAMRAPSCARPPPLRPRLFAAPSHRLVIFRTSWTSSTSSLPSSSAPDILRSVSRPRGAGRYERPAVPLKQPISVAEQNAIHAKRAVLKQNEQSGMPLQYIDLASLVYRAARANDLALATELLEEIDKRGMKHTTPQALRSLLQAAARAGALDKVEWTAQQLTMAGLSMDVTSYNAWITALVRSQRLNDAEDKFKEMQKHGHEPSVITYHALLSGYANADDKEKAYALLDEMQRLGLPWNEYTWTPLIYMHARRGEPQEVRVLMERVQSSGARPTARMYNSLLAAYSRANQHNRLPGVLEEMIAEGVAPIRETYNTVIASCAKMGDFQAARERIVEMKAREMPLDLWSLSPILAHRAKRGEIEEAEAVLTEMHENKIVPGVGEGLTLITGWLTKGQIERARAVLSLLEKYGVELTRQLYMPIVTAYAEMRQHKTALELIAEMRRRGFPIHGWVADFEREYGHLNSYAAATQPTTAAPPSAAAAATSTPSSVESASHPPPPAPAAESESPPTSHPVWNERQRTTHLRNLLTAGNLREAERVLESMETHGPQPSLFTFTLLVGHFGKRGNFAKLDEMLAKMKKRNIEMDHVTLTKLLRSYAHYRRPVDALRVWEQLSVQLKNLNMQPTPQQYHDVIFSLLERSELRRAVELCEEMRAANIKPLGGTFVWIITALLNSGHPQHAVVWSGYMTDAGYSLVEPLASRVREARGSVY